jgi:hypothetical protein
MDIDWNWDTITTINLVSSLIILVIGLIGYGGTRKTVSLYIGLAFGLFGLSHLATLAGLKDSLKGELIGVRTLGYLVIAFVLYEVAFRRKAGAA